MATTIKIGGTAIDQAGDDVWLGRLDLERGGFGTLTLQRRKYSPKVPVFAAPDPADSLLAKEVRVEIDGFGTAFVGDVVDEQIESTAAGQAVTYQVRDLRNRGDLVPLVDSNTRTEEANYNRPASDVLYVPGRSGRTVGEVVADVLTMADNAAALSAMGIGGYTVSSGAYSLPPATVADLAALDRIPTKILTVAGNKLLSAVSSFLETNAPNRDMVVGGDGVIRFLDSRSPVEQVLKLGDPIDRAMPPTIRRSVADCKAAVVIRGRPRTEAKLVSLSNGGLEPAYAHDDLTVAQAEAAWSPDDYLRGNRSEGTCVVDDTLHVTIDPSDPTQAWAANAWAQDGWAGMVVLHVAVVAGVDSTVTRRVVANTALTAGGTCSITLDEPLPATDYTRFELLGKNSGAALVYRRYRVADPAIRAALARKFSTDGVWVWADGQAATTTSYPMASVAWSETGAPPYKESTDDFTLDGDGYVTFTRPTYLTAGKKPDDVKVLLAVNVGTLAVRVPTSGYEGSANSRYGVTTTAVEYVKDWTDPNNLPSQEAYARELLNACKDVTVDVTIVVKKLWLPALDFANGLSVASDFAATGLEDANLPIRSVSLEWNNLAATFHTMTIQASNRRRSLQPDGFLPPERQREGYTWGRDDSVISPGRKGR